MRERRFDAAHILACEGVCNLLIAAGRCVCGVRACKAISLARLRLFARLSSASQSERRALRPERSELRRATLLLWRRPILFRRTWLCPWPLEWRQLRPVLDLYAYRTD